MTLPFLCIFFSIVQECYNILGIVVCIDFKGPESNKINNDLKEASDRQNFNDTILFPRASVDINHTPSLIELDQTTLVNKVHACK